MNGSRPPITKTDAAKRQLVAAIRLFFRNCDPIPVYALGHAAREILADVCAHMKKKGLTDYMVETHKVSRKDVFQLAGKHSNFFKHARRDPDGVLIDFDEEDVDSVLYAAVHDLQVATEYLLPVECQVFEIWLLMAHPETKILQIDDTYNQCARELLGGLPILGRNEQKRRGLELLQVALSSGEVMDHPKTDRSTLEYWPASL